MQPTEPFWKEVATYLTMPLGALLFIIWTGLNSRIKKVESNQVSVETFNQHVESDERVQSTLERTQREMRLDIAKLFELLRQQTEASHRRHIELLNAIYANGHGRSQSTDDHQS